MPTILSLVAKGAIDLTSVTTSYPLAEAAQAYRDLADSKIVGRAIIKM
jgi:D-arabinose 1-dehydrogenase-like Zn-dependent alcohol dehydrogenase